MAGNTLLNQLIDAVVTRTQQLVNSLELVVVARREFRNPQGDQIQIGYAGEQASNRTMDALSGRVVVLELEIMQAQADGETRVLEALDKVIPLLDGFVPFTEWGAPLRFQNAELDGSLDGIPMIVARFQVSCPVRV